MASRRCSWCNSPMRWWSKLLRFWTCNDCASRMSMGGSPKRWRNDDDQP